MEAGPRTAPGAEQGAAQVDDHAGNYCKDLIFMQRRHSSSSSSSDV